MDSDDNVQPRIYLFVWVEESLYKWVIPLDMIYWLINFILAAVHTLIPCSHGQQTWNITIFSYRNSCTCKTKLHIVTLVNHYIIDDEDDDNDGYGGDDDDEDDKTYIFISDTYFWWITCTHTVFIIYIYQTNFWMIVKFKIHIGYPHLYIRANIELRLIS